MKKVKKRGKAFRELGEVSNDLDEEEEGCEWIRGVM